jgi:hypothetical protein
MATDLRNVSVVSPITIFLMSGLELDIEPVVHPPPPAVDEDDEEQEEYVAPRPAYTVSLDGWCKARMEPASAKTTLALRKSWDAAFEAIACGAGALNPFVMPTIEAVLALETNAGVGTQVQMQRLQAGGGRGGGGGGGRRGGGGKLADWTCSKCRASVFGSKSACFKCGAPKGSSVGEGRGGGGRGGGGRGRGGRRGK